jgi:hypothetical protein
MGKVILNLPCHWMNSSMIEMKVLQIKFRVVKEK